MSGFNPNNLFIYHNPGLEPGWNLALEEYLLKHRNENFLVLWRNKRAIVTGKHQVSYKEVNYPFCLDEEIAVHRRLSGGGTVFHDLGNVNFTFIENRPDKNRLIDFKRYLQPVAAFLNESGIPATLSDRNDLLLNEFKISGNAQHIEQKLQRVIHHGTLLVNSDLESLREGLQRTNTLYETKAVDSVRSKVMNLNGLKSTTLKAETIIEEMSDHFSRVYSGSDWSLTDQEINIIDVLAKEKYNTWKWNIGYSPKYKATIFRNGTELELNVKNGQIIDAYMHKEPVQALSGIDHSYMAMEKACQEIDALKEFSWRELF